MTRGRTCRPFSLASPHPARSGSLCRWPRGVRFLSGDLDPLVAFLWASFAMAQSLGILRSIFSGFEQIQYEAALKLGATRSCSAPASGSCSGPAHRSGIGAAMFGAIPQAGRTVLGAVCRATANGGLFPPAFHPRDFPSYRWRPWPLILMGVRGWRR